MIVGALSVNGVRNPVGLGHLESGEWRLYQGANRAVIPFTSRYSLRMNPRTVFNVEFRGREYVGTYEIAEKMLYVFFNGKRKAAQLGGLKSYPETLARHLLLDLADPNWVHEIEVEATMQPKRKVGVELRRGPICVQVKDEMKRFRYMAREEGKSLAEIKAENPEFFIWKMTESDQLANADRETLLHPNQWGAGYPNLILGKYFKVSKFTIRDYVTKYNQAEKKPSQ